MKYVAMLYADRPLRVLSLLAAVWVLNGADLFLTLLEREGRLFGEANPVATLVVQNLPAIAVVAYKLGLVLFASDVFYMFRHRGDVELGCWIALAAYVVVMARWSAYYGYVEVCQDDPAGGLL